MSRDGYQVYYLTKVKSGKNNIIQTSLTENYSVNYYCLEHDFFFFKYVGKIVYKF